MVRTFDQKATTAFWRERQRTRRGEPVVPVHHKKKGRNTVATFLDFSF
jgi:hypothetical protein